MAEREGNSVYRQAVESDKRSGSIDADAATPLPSESNSNYRQAIDAHRRAGSIDADTPKSSQSRGPSRQ
ncbi:uncharacterized protein EURHEDRAFT_386087 [Aspergillus ruber CBS 135680]|uniref:Uncharacterized protein n=1 Tax=Aspergillus ruber (strain CBS 135680) TaxID=1388766 RepID=A0A017SF96_ASPRC|nr:uncharacterized protein EURHEDRAFT_386087 [Aspergillus ruber CBS 135680]EYE95683.1 hypothetical protein EURHEDRAFT_386087 [Aspergillus ruber CBS 135680]